MRYLYVSQNEGMPNYDLKKSHKGTIDFEAPNRETHIRGKFAGLRVWDSFFTYCFEGFWIHRIHFCIGLFLWVQSFQRDFLGTRIGSPSWIPFSHHWESELAEIHGKRFFLLLISVRANQLTPNDLRGKYHILYTDPFGEQDFWPKKPVPINSFFFPVEPEWRSF